MRQSILAVATGTLTLPDAFYSMSISITRRGDGCHMLAISGRAKVDPTAQVLRFARKFVPMFARRWRNLSPGGLQGAFAGHEGLSRWRLDRPTPMEHARILDPGADPKTVRLTLKRAAGLILALGSVPMVASWAGFVDSTPDGEPVISEVPTVPGPLLAAGFSGHGFGTGLVPRILSPTSRPGRSLWSIRAHTGFRASRLAKRSRAPNFEASRRALPSSARGSPPSDASERHNVPKLLENRQPLPSRDG